MIKDRYLTTNILNDLSEKMAFIGGARQVGKTTLAKELIAPNYKEFAYFNWDARSYRKKIMG